MRTTIRRKKWGKKLVWVKKRGAKCLAAILSAGLLVSQMSIGAMATDSASTENSADQEVLGARKLAENFNGELSENGVQVSGRVYEVEGEKYTFDENGVLIN